MSNNYKVGDTYKDYAKLTKLLGQPYPGFKNGDKFVIVTDEESYAELGEVVELCQQDGTDCPYFKTDCDNHWSLGWSNLAVLPSETKVKKASKPRTPKAIDISKLVALPDEPNQSFKPDDKFIVLSIEARGNLVPGSIITLRKNDISQNPAFDNDFTLPNGEKSKIENDNNPFHYVHLKFLAPLTGKVKPVKVTVPTEFKSMASVKTTVTKKIELTDEGANFIKWAKDNQLISK